MRTFKFILPFEIIVDKRRRRILILALFYKAIPDHTTASTPVWDYPTLKPFFITAQSLSTLTVAVNIQLLNQRQEFSLKRWNVQFWAILNKKSRSAAQVFRIHCAAHS